MLIDALSALCAQLTRDLLAIAKFLSTLRNLYLFALFTVFAIVTRLKYTCLHQFSKFSNMQLK